MTEHDNVQTANATLSTARGITITQALPQQVTIIMRTKNRWRKSPISGALCRQTLRHAKIESRITPHTKYVCTLSAVSGLFSCHSTVQSTDTYLDPGCTCVCFEQQSHGCDFRPETFQLRFVPHTRDATDQNNGLSIRTALLHKPAPPPPLPTCLAVDTTLSVTHHASTPRPSTPRQLVFSKRERKAFTSGTATEGTPGGK